MSKHLSEFDRMKHERLPDWGFWGRDDCGRPDPEAGCGAIYQMGKDDETERDPDAAPELTRRIDRKDCERLDVLIANNIGRTHRNTIKNYYYKRRATRSEDVDAAVRALLDVEFMAEEFRRAA